MKRVATTFVLIFIAWLVLTLSMNIEELVAGFIISLSITVICRHLLSRDTPRIILHPVRWMWFIVYLGFMLCAEVRAHCSVAMAVLTGRIRPAMVEVPVRFRTQLGKTLLGNSITLTPGTLTVDARHDKRFYVHALVYKKGTDMGKSFHMFGLRVIK